MTKTLYTVFKTHFDYGFTDRAEAVMEHYIYHFIPRALEICLKTREQGYRYRYVWTLPSYVLHKALETLAGSREGDLLADLTTERQIVWHALPFTFHTDLMRPEDLSYGFRYSDELTQRFGYRPISAKMTDVPGHSLFLPSLLAEKGIRFLHLGCNSCSTPPDLPPLFWWEGTDGKRILTMYSKGGYGSGAEAPVNWPFPVWLNIAHTHDNLGPHSFEELKGIIAASEKAAEEVRFGTLDDFARAMLNLNPQLPIITGDLSDSWIHGLGSMPREVAVYRQISRGLAVKEREGKLNLSNPVLRESYNKTRENLLFFAEHTWGLDCKLGLPLKEGERPYGKAALAKAIKEGRYKKLEQTWADKKAYIDRALEGYRFLLSAESNENTTSRKTGTKTDWSEPADREQIILNNGALSLSLDSKTGCPVKLTFNDDEFIAGSEKWGEYSYSVYGREDINTYLKEYGYNLEPWYLLDFGKFDYPLKKGKTWRGGEDLSILKDGSGEKVLVSTSLPSVSSNLYGNGQNFSLEISLPPDGSFLDLRCTLERKSPTLHSEAGYISFPFNFSNPKILFDKGGCTVDPSRDILTGASHHIYAAGDWIYMGQGHRGVLIIPLDTPLFSLGKEGIQRFSPCYSGNNSHRLIFNLFNNQWGTNFPQWIDGDITSRFRLYFLEGSTDTDLFGKLSGECFADMD
jgi:hypothetical protein